ncbi:MAG: DUF1566 domain-containing protein [Treponema sp.]|jgi:TolB-like protein|nr:DUF1566 domain-containing protein [Treponema sp.]
MKKLLAGLGIFFVVLAAGVYAQQTVVVAVAPFEARAGIAAGDAETITEVYSIRLSVTRSVRVVNREALDRVVREHRFQAGDWSDDRKTAELGRALNADWVVRGTLQKLSSNFIITVSILDIRTLEVKGGADMRINSIDDAYDSMGTLVAQTLKTITTGMTYNIGDRGPGGGFIFYAQGGAYMECSAMLGALGWDQAMSTAQNYRGGGYDDWRLPTQGELDLIYKNLRQKNLGGMGGDWYWSSTQYGAHSYAWAQRFSDGNQGTIPKDNTGSVRAVRAF